MPPTRRAEVGGRRELTALIILVVATVMIVQPTVLAAIEVARSARAAARGPAAVQLLPS